MFGYCDRLRAVSLFVNRSAMFVEAVFKSTFGFSYVLFVTVVTLYHVDNVFGVAVSQLVTFKTLFILSNTLKKEGRAFRNIGKNISLYCVISLANFVY